MSAKKGKCGRSLLSPYAKIEFHIQLLPSYIYKHQRVNTRQQIVHMLFLNIGDLQ